MPYDPITGPPVVGPSMAAQSFLRACAEFAEACDRATRSFRELGETLEAIEAARRMRFRCAARRRGREAFSTRLRERNGREP